MSPAAVLRRQARSRQALRNAAAGYAHLRSVTGTHNELIRAELRDGTPVMVLIIVSIVPDPT